LEWITMPERREHDLEAELRALARHLDQQSRPVDPDAAMGATAPGRRARGPLLAAAAVAVLVVAGVTASVWSVDGGQELDVSGDSAPDGAVESPLNTTTTPVPPDQTDASYSGTAFADLPEMGVAVSDGTTVTLLSLDGAKLGVATGSVVVEMGTGPQRRTLVMRPGDVLEAVDPDPAEAPDGCDEAAGGGGLRVALCGGAPQDRTSIVAVTPDGEQIPVTGAAPGSRNAGHWQWGIPNAEGTRILGQWSGECESQTAFFIEADGSGIVTVDGQPGIPTVGSTGLGWAPDGRAIVQFSTGACGPGSENPGIYLVDPATSERTLVHAENDPAAQLASIWTRQAYANDGERTIARALDELGLEGCCGEPSHGGTSVASGARWQGFNVFIGGNIAGDDPKVGLQDEILSVEEIEIGGAPTALLQAADRGAYLAFTCGDRVWGIGGGGLGDRVPAGVLRSLTGTLLPHLYCTVGLRPEVVGFG
jgi:hypothetical protein